MKKRTVITTEKREIWVIRQSGDLRPEEELAGTENESPADSWIASPGEHSEMEIAPDEEG